MAGLIFRFWFSDIKYITLSHRQTNLNKTHESLRKCLSPPGKAGERVEPAQLRVPGEELNPLYLNAYSHTKD